MSNPSKPGLLARLRAKFKSGGNNNKLTQKQKQWINLGIGLTLFISAALIVSSMIGGPANDPATVNAGHKTPDSIPLVVPGETVNDRDRWMGNAGQQVASLQEKLNEQTRTNDDLNRRLQMLEQGRDKGNQPNLANTPGQPSTAFPPATPATAAGTASPAPQTTAGAPATAAQANPAVTPAQQPTAAQPSATPRAINSPETFPAQPRSGGGNVEAAKRLPVNGAQSATAGMPPGSPNSLQGAQPNVAVDDGPRLIRVSLSDEDKPASKDSAKAAADSEKSTKSRHIGTYLPVSFARIRLIGGLDAPTGGQAQNNPLPVFLKIEDNAFLPNHFRSRVKDCFVVAAAYGDKSSERAYVRTETLSCVTRSGQAIEVPLKGSVYGEDGKLGFRGTVATKQGQILANAAAAGVASGIGQGFSSKYTTFTTTPIGTSETINSDKILQAGLATGFGNAMDRLAKYWISVAEQMHPVIEIDASRVGDLFITKGTMLEFPLEDMGATAGTDNRARINRTSMFRKGYVDDEE